MFIVSVGLRAQQDPLLGTWKLNLAKSKYSPGMPPKSQTLKFEAQGDALKITADTANADGTVAHLEHFHNLCIPAAGPEGPDCE